METALGGTLTDVVSAVVEEPGDVCVACVAPSAVVAVVDALEGSSRDDPVRLLAPADAVRAVDRDHVTAARLSDLIARGAVEVRVAERVDETVMVTDDRVVCVLTDLPSQTLGVPTTDAAVVATTREGFDARWDSSEAYERSSPTYSDLVSSMRERFGDETADDLEAAVASPTVRGIDGTMDLIDLLVLLAARHRHQLYELTQWGSDAGVASVGTFSQSKRRLEDIGLVDTETVHSGDVGRPRQRLVVGDEALRNADVEELVAAAHDVLID